MNILVQYTGNSARSILTECPLRKLGGGPIRSISAGSQPDGRVHSQSSRLLTAEGYDTDDLRSKSWDEFAATGASKMDAIIPVCGSSAEETCPIGPRAAVRAHWGAAATPEAAPQKFREAYDILGRRAQTFVTGLEAAMDARAPQTLLTTCGSPP